MKKNIRYKRIEEIVSKANENPARLAVITGGEPTLHNLEALTAGLKKAGFATNIETSGSSPLTGTMGLDMPFTQKI